MAIGSTPTPSLRMLVLSFLLTGITLACTTGSPAASTGGPGPTGGATVPASSTAAASAGQTGDPCTMATAAELTAATTVPFADGVAEQVPGVGAACKWQLVPDEPMIVAQSGFVLILFRPMTLERAKLVDGGVETTIGGRAAVVGGGQSHGVANIDAGGGVLLRVEMSLGPAVQEKHQVDVEELMPAVAEVAAGHL